MFDATEQSSYAKIHDLKVHQGEHWHLVMEKDIIL